VLHRPFTGNLQMRLILRHTDVSEAYNIILQGFQYKVFFEMRGLSREEKYAEKSRRVFLSVQTIPGS
jgi:hypothetical protein